MKQAWLFCILTFTAVTAWCQQANDISRYNVTWQHKPGGNSSESMPCGGGDIGLNVWIEEDALCFYIARSGAFDENNTMLKLGRVRVSLSSMPFRAKDLTQQLRLQDGSIQITGSNTTIHIWVDVYRPVVHVAINSKEAAEVNAVYENWRYQDRAMADKELRASSYKFPQKFSVITYKDAIAFEGDEVLFYHRNRNDVENIFDYTVKMEQLNAVKDSLWNPVRNRTFGGYMKGRNMQAAGNLLVTNDSATYSAWILKSNRKLRNTEIELGLHVGQTSTLDAWKTGLQQIAADAERQRKTAQAQTAAWWKQFWNRSYIYIDSDNDSVQAMGRNYQLFRYMLGCNAYGAYPTKSNGGLFTFDAKYANEQYRYNADFRLWGGGTMTAQNQRLVYFPMLKSGDIDMMPSQFDFYRNALHNAELRTHVYWGHNGASFTEQMENFGLPNIAEYGIKRPAGYDAGMEYNAWLEYLWETSFEFCLMILEAERYAGKDITAYIPLIESCLTFYDEHYQYLAKKLGAKAFDEEGHYVFYPGSAAETYKMTYNSTTVISALTVVLSRMQELPQHYLSPPQRDKWAAMLKRIPPIPFRECEGHTTLSPAQLWQRVQNSEAPQLYPVYPWGLFGIGKPGLDTAINTWKYDPQVIKYRSHVGWRQYNIFAARLGLTAEAAQYNLLKLANGPHRFPAFWGPGFDWTPDQNWGGSGMIGLQEMLMQTDGKKIYLLPAWPASWNASFKLHAPYNTTVEATVVNGTVQQLKVTPESRRADVIVWQQH
ncbi:hypothetical protein SAMN05421788_11513 [Filimonas lacunae]|uniref:DUF5703 domain-containing protein n=1 Tax=Filimonas lacunae TaxID=477680 RepID=A0A173MC89_9BACT|nr:DUF5703 domain-containing protein [Filimonas lacunae]BAV05147.1 hypothetical protein FLA_1154 [Filimonas lacunae]SIT34152.1 hypothetical protein SAMN05421788_11513 [Filimonas lacunae]